MNTLPHSAQSGCKVRLIATLALAAAVPAFADSSSTSSSSPTTSAYIEPPRVTVTETYSTPTYYGSSYSSGYYSGGSFYGGAGGYWPSTYTTTRVYQPSRYFFPPYPPALGENYVKNRTKSASMVRSSIPLGLSEYVYEPFYSPLSTFLYDEYVSKSRQKRLDQFLAERTILTKELTAKLESLQSADTATREAQLATFAAVQAPRLQALEKLAYDIRDDLTQWHLFSTSADWNEARYWRLGDDARYESTMDDAKVMRGAAYFQEGLSPAQRRLLREYAMELDDSARGPSDDIALDVKGPYFYFAPEMSRVRLPADMPADLAAKVASYSQRKAALKKQLRDTLYREDRRWFDSKRAAALRQLAAQQAPEFAALDALAEEIRRGLAPLPNPSRPPSVSSMLPNPISSRVSTYMAKREAYLKIMNQQIAELKRQFPTSRVEFVKMGNGFGIQLVPNRKLKADQESMLPQTRAQLDAFNQRQVDAYVGLVNDKEAIRTAVVQAAGGVGSMITPRIIDAMLREYTSTMSVQELWNQYRDYDTAVLQPGLSPEQRRLLFGAALMKLNVQIPPYTY